MEQRKLKGNRFCKKYLIKNAEVIQNCPNFISFLTILSFYFHTKLQLTTVV